MNGRHPVQKKVLLQKKTAIKLITKRFLAGKAWNKRGKVSFISGSMTTEGVEILSLIAKQTKRRINFYLLPNRYKATTANQPHWLMFVPYWVRK